MPTAASWNLSDPVYADELIRSDQIDLLMVGRPTLANPRWPFYAATVLGREAPYDVRPDQYRYFLAKAKDIPHVSGFGDVRLRPAAD